jgi:hypothetical protein
MFTSAEQWLFGDAAFEVERLVTIKKDPQPTSKSSTHSNNREIAALFIYCSVRITKADNIGY